MHYFKNYSMLLFALVLTVNTAKGQNTIEAPRGYDTQIGNMVSMLEDLKGRVTRSVIDLDQNGTDFLLDQDANRIGAMIYHLAATEKYYQVFTFENRSFTKDEEAIWGTPLSLGANAREQLVDQPISYYLDIWDQVRQDTLRLLKEKDDQWFAKNVNAVNMNNHWAWYHVMEHQANHMGQIRFIVKRIN